MDHLGNSLSGWISLANCLSFSAICRVSAALVAATAFCPCDVIGAPVGKPLQPRGRCFALAWCHLVGFNEANAPAGI